MKHKDRAARYSVYCDGVIGGGKLKRHVFGRHKAEDEVKTILKKSKQDQVK